MELAGADEPVPARAPDGAGLAEGELIEDRYQCERRLGRGGMGEVWSARELRSGKRVALELLDVAGGAEAARRFERESLELYRQGAVPGSSTHPADTLGELVDLLLKLHRDDEASALLPPPGDPAWADDELAGGAVQLALRRGDRAAAERVLEWARRATGDSPPDWLQELEREVHADARR